MPEPTPADALERMRRQVRAVRWRQNLHELQRALYRLLATLAAAAAALVVAWTQMNRATNSTPHNDSLIDTGTQVAMNTTVL